MKMAKNVRWRHLWEKKCFWDCKMCAFGGGDVEILDVVIELLLSEKFSLQKKCSRQNCGY